MKKQTLIILMILFSLAGIFGAFLGIEKVLIFLLILAIIGIVLADYQIIAYALCLYPFIDFVLRSFVPNIASVWDELLFIAMFLVWGYKYLKYREQDGFKQTPLDLPVMLFLIAMLVVFIINSPDYRISLEGFRAVIQYILWYFVIIQLLKDTKGAKRICLIFVIVVSLMAIHGVYQYIIGVEMPAGWVDSKEAGVRTRVFSILTSPNILGSLVTLALPLTLSFGAISKNNKTKALFYILALTMVGCLEYL